MIRRWIAHWKCQRQQLPPEVCRYLERFAERNWRHLPLDQVRFVVLDTETSGLNPRKDLVLSIGAVAIRRLEIVIEDSFEAIIAHKQQLLPQESISIHGLRPRDIEEGEVPETVLRRWLQYVDNSVLVGQHIAFDRSIISASLRRLWGIRLYNPEIDTAHLAMRIEHPNRSMEEISSSDYSLDKLAKRYHLRPEERHTAIGDAFLTAQLFLIFVHKLQRSGVQTLQDLLRWKRL